jgi:hypothetical protein
MRGGASPLWTVFAGFANKAIMDRKDNKPQANPTKTNREDRLKAALKANMAKRKAQARARAAASDNKQKE